MKLSMYQVDAFTHQRFKGNPAAVVPLEAWLPDALMQDIAQENNLAETAFFVPEGNGWRLRWFTPTVEVNLCGHATVAAAHILYAHLGCAQPQLAFQSKSGVLTVTRHEGQYTLDFPTDTLTPLNAHPTLAAALHVVPVEVWRGREDWLVVLESQAQVEALQPDFRGIAAAGGRGTLVTAPGVEVDFVSRCFFPQSGVDEDSVTGSAHTTLTPYWAQRLGKNELTARQLSRRGGELHLKLSGERTKISGGAVTYLVGEIFMEGYSMH